MSQPWVRGRYTHALGSESMGASTVLTLDPIATEVSMEQTGSKLIELQSNLSSDSDGYYA